MREIPLQVTTGQGVLDTRQRPMRDLRISVMDRCNFRCPYCMPEDRYPREFAFLKEAQRLSFAEIIRLSRSFVALGVNKLRITGGEPLLRKNLAQLVKQLKNEFPNVDIALTTNGVLLPDQARGLREAGLDRLTVSLDALDPTIFAALSGERGQVAEVLAGIDAAQSAGFSRIKLNCVVQRGVNETEVLPLIERFRGSGHVLRFIEFMDVGTCNNWRVEQVVTQAQIIRLIEEKHALKTLPSNYRGEVAQRAVLADGSLEIGFVSSVSQPFCGDCSRARLSAGGLFYTCLFAKDGFDLRQVLREHTDDDALTEAIAKIWRVRADRYSEIRAAAPSQEKVEMYAIGG
jgi:GTP 3',8-cyclase